MPEDYEIEGYEPLFELGLYKKDSPGCRVIPKEAEIDPIVLAALMVTLFETVMKSVPDSDQILFEDKFHKAFEMLMRERFQYETITKYPDKY